MSVFNLGPWVCGIPFGLIVLMLLAMLSSKRTLQRELDELNKRVAEVKVEQQYNDGNLLYLGILALLLVLPFLTLAELIMLGHPLARCAPDRLALYSHFTRGGKTPPLVL